MPAFQDYQIAAAWNNAAGLTNIGLIVPSGNIAFPEPIARPNYVPGLKRIRLDLLTYTTGYPSQTWLLAFTTWKQYDHLLSTYCGGGQSGKVTIRTRYRSTAYANYNAILDVPTPDTLQATGIGYANVPLLFRRMVAI